MIKSFACKNTNSVWNSVRVKQWSIELQEKAHKKLRHLNHACTLRDLSQFPGNRLEELKGNRKGEYSIRVNDQWRICFRWDNGNAVGVKLQDYH